MGKRVSYVSDARRMTTKLNGISELLALFPLPPPLAESAVNHRSGRGVAYATNVRRAHASKAFARFGRSGDCSVHVLAQLGSPHSCGRRRDGHTAPAVPWFARLPITLAVLFALSVFTHNDVFGMPSPSAWLWFRHPGTGDMLPPHNASGCLLGC